MSQPVNLYLRVRLPDGSYPYLKAAYTSNGRIRPHHSIHNGRAVSFPGSNYYLRYRLNKKRVWQPVGPDPSLASTRLLAKALELQGSAAPPTAAPTALPPNVPVEPTASKRLLGVCAAEYIDETAKHKSAKTLAAYRLAVLLFCEIATGIPFPKRQALPLEHTASVQKFLDAVAATGLYIEDVTRDHLLAYVSGLRGQASSSSASTPCARPTTSSPRTVRNRIDHLQIFLHHFKVPSILTGKDLPKYTEKKVRAYNSSQLARLFEKATLDESDLLHCFLCTGAREQEAQYVCWSDVDLELKTYTVTEHLDLGYRPKDKEEGSLPTPDILVKFLRARRERYPKTRLISPARTANRTVMLSASSSGSLSAPGSTAARA